MTQQIRMIPFNEDLRRSFFEFTRQVHPGENNLKNRMEWFALGNPLLEKKNTVPGLFAVTPTNDIVGHFLMSPFEYHARHKKQTGYFGYDFFVREDYRTQGVGALLFVQAVRTFQPFLGVGVTLPVEKIAQAAGIKSLGSLKKFLWINRPISLGLHWLSHRLKFKVEYDKAGLLFPEVLEIEGMKFRRYLQIPDRWNDVRTGDDAIDVGRSRSYLQWRFFSSPRKYQFYYSSEWSAYFVVRPALYQGMKLLLIAETRTAGSFERLSAILRGAKQLARQLELDGVVMASTCGVFDKHLIAENFVSVGRPSPVLANLPSNVPTGTPVCLSMADADLDFSFGDPL